MFIHPRTSYGFGFLDMKHIPNGVESGSRTGIDAHNEDSYGTSVDG